jgi:predicted nucleic acid-binding protein
MGMQKIVIDTNVLMSALLSSRGASFKLISLVGRQYFDYAMSVPLMIEYEDVLKRENAQISLSDTAINNILDRLCFYADLRKRGSKEQRKRGSSLCLTLANNMGRPRFLAADTVLWSDV